MGKLNCMARWYRAYTHEHQRAERFLLSLLLKWRCHMDRSYTRTELLPYPRASEHCRAGYHRQRICWTDPDCFKRYLDRYRHHHLYLSVAARHDEYRRRDIEHLCYFILVYRRNYPRGRDRRERHLAERYCELCGYCGSGCSASISTSLYNCTIYNLGLPCGSVQRQCCLCWCRWRTRQK